jgi:hypothetical protein
MDIDFQRNIDQRGSTVDDATAGIILLAAAPVVDESMVMPNSRTHEMLGAVQH